MQFERKFALFCFDADGSFVYSNVFDDYESAYDSAILAAIKDLPNERVYAFTITEINVNAAVVTLKKGD